VAVADMPSAPISCLSPPLLFLSPSAPVADTLSPAAILGSEILQQFMHKAGNTGMAAPVSQALRFSLAALARLPILAPVGRAVAEREGQTVTAATADTAIPTPLLVDGVLAEAAVVTAVAPLAATHLMQLTVLDMGVTITLVMVVAFLVTTMVCVMEAAALMAVGAVPVLAGAVFLVAAALEAMVQIGEPI